MDINEKHTVTLPPVPALTEVETVTVTLDKNEIALIARALDEYGSTTLSGDFCGMLDLPVVDTADGSPFRLALEDAKVIRAIKAARIEGNFDGLASAMRFTHEYVVNNPWVTTAEQVAASRRWLQARE